MKRTLKQSIKWLVSFLHPFRFDDGVLAYPAQCPGFASQDLCFRQAFDSIGTAYGCRGWLCVCDRYSGAVSSLVSIVSKCSVPQDVAVATSIFNGFCNQLPGVVTLPESQYSIATPPVVPAIGQTATVTVATPSPTTVTLTPSRSNPRLFV